MDKLDVDEEVADILIAEGFTSLEEVAYVPITEMMEIESFDEDTVNELRSRARNALLTEAIVREESVENVEEALLSLEGMDTDVASKLAANGITTRDALADLATDELTEMTGIADERAVDLIMKARAHWFEPEAETGDRRRGKRRAEVKGARSAQEITAWRRSTIEQFASELKMPAGALLEQLAAAGVDVKKEGDKLTEQDKTRLLDYLRKQHGAAAEPKKRITLTRKQTTEIKAADSTGKARTIQVEVRKKRVLVRREEEAARARRGARASRKSRRSAAAPRCRPRRRAADAAVAAAAPTPAAPAIGSLSPEEIAAREEESRKAQALAKRQTDEHEGKAGARDRAQDEEGTRRRGSGGEGRCGSGRSRRGRQGRRSEAGRDAKAPADAKAKTEGTLHRPAAKPGEKRERATKKAPGQVFQEEAARRRALKLRGDTGGAAAAPGWRGPKVGGRHRDDEGGDAASGLAGPVVREVSVPETITVAELAHKMSVKATEVIKAMMKLGTMVTINQMLDQETAMIVVEEMGHKAQCREARRSGFAAGGIAWRIGGRIAAAAAGRHGHGSRRPRQDVAARHDPPHARGERRGGRHHAAHRRVSRRNARRASSRSSTRRATRRSRRCARAAPRSPTWWCWSSPPTTASCRRPRKRSRTPRRPNVPLVVAINKIDKPEANPERVKQELVAESVLPEEYGGDVQFIPVSAKTGEGIDRLLDGLLLQAEVLELKAREGRAGAGAS